MSPLHSNSPNNIMAAINTALVAREAISTLVKRNNWAAENAGVMVVFCIVFVGMQSDAFPPPDLTPANSQWLN